MIIQVPVGSEPPPIPESMKRHYKPKTWVCAYCGTPQPENSNPVACPNCGARTVKQKVC